MCSGNFGIADYFRKNRRCRSGKYKNDVAAYRTYPHKQKPQQNAAYRFYPKITNQKAAYC